MRTIALDFPPGPTRLNATCFGCKPQQVFVLAALVVLFVHVSMGIAADTNSSTIRGLVVDATTGLPTACTVRITDSTGKIVVESDSLRAGLRCNGQFTKTVVPGQARIRVTRGFETRAAEQNVDVPAGGTVDVKFVLERVVDLRQRHWFAGDSHVHMLHGEKTVPVTFDYVALAARAEDLQYLSLCQTWILSDATPENLQRELGSRSRPDCLLTWNLEEPKNYYRGDAGRCLGHCWTLGMNGRTSAGDDVIKILLQASAHDYEVQKPTYLNFESHALIHAQGGSVFYTHPARWWTGPWGGQGGYPKQERMRVSNMAVELPLDVLIGPSFDGVDLITTGGEVQANAKAFELWCLLLNHGYRLAGTASSDSCFDRPGGGTPGVARTYTYLDQGFSLPAVAKAMAAGRNFVTTGPLLLTTMEGKPPGTVLPANGQPVQLHIESWASGQDPKGLTRLELWRNGKLAQSIALAGHANFTTNLSLVEKETAWYCVRLFGGDPQRQQAISGAFFFQDKNFQPPTPVPARIQVRLLDAQTGEPLSGTITEVAYHGTLPVLGKRHPITTQPGKTIVTIPANLRLKAEVAGYKSATLSPILDNPVLVEFVTGLKAEDLVRWYTFEQIKKLLEQVSLTFRLQRETR